MQDRKKDSQLDLMSFSKKRILPLCISLVFIAIGTVGVTNAFLIDKTASVTNTFKVDDITYELVLVANPPSGYSVSQVSMPTITPDEDSSKAGAQKTKAAGSVDFKIDKAPTLNDYSFKGWSVALDEYTPLYGPDDRTIQVGYKDPYTKTSGDKVKLTLYAHWVPSTQYVITYDANASDASFDNGSKVFTETKTHDVTYTLSQEKPDRGTYWVWTEWNTKPDGTGKTYLGGNEYKENKNLTLYAIWKPKTKVTFGDPDFVNMDDPSVVQGANEYNFTVKCRTRGGADGIAIPVYNLIPGQAYKLTFSVSFNDFQFYTEDSRSYIFGTNIIDTYDKYHTALSILSQPDKTVTSRYENMQWSTESSGTFDIFLEFVPNKQTMYWFWETTDIVDGQLMSYVFNNFNIQMLENPGPRIEFEDLTVKFHTAPFINTAIGNNPLIGVTQPIDMNKNKYGTRWVDYKNNLGQELTARHKNYFHTEKYSFDSLRYRIWGYDGHEVMTIPISGLTVGKTYTIDFKQDLTGAYGYNDGRTPSTVNSDQLYGCAVTAHADMDANYNTTNSVNKQPGYQDLRAGVVGKVSNQSITFTATSETMYWQWLLGDLIDGMNSLCNNRYSVVDLDDVKLREHN